MEKVYLVEVEEVVNDNTILNRGKYVCTTLDKVEKVIEGNKKIYPYEYKEEDYSSEETGFVKVYRSDEIVISIEEMDLL